MEEGRWVRKEDGEVEVESRYEEQEYLKAPSK